MPTPRISQAAQTISSDCASASTTSPVAMTTLEADSTPRPPKLSMVLPMRGPIRAEISSEAENAPNTQLLSKPISCAIGTARMAMR